MFGRSPMATGWLLFAVHLWLVAALIVGAAIYLAVR